MTGPVLRNHSSTVTRAKRPVTATWTALRFEHTVMQAGAVVPISVEDTGVLIFTLAGRGVMLLDGDRIEVAANDLVHIPAGVPYGFQTLGGADWSYVVLQAPVE